MLIKVARQSLLDRKGTVALTVLMIAVSVFVLLGIEHIRNEAREGFNRTVTGTDLIVGARTGQLNLLLYSVFRVGSATNNIDWKSYQHFAAHPQVAWTIPISLGDSYRGYRVMGTNDNYFEYFRYGDNKPLRLQSGKQFEDVFDAVLGAEVARKLGHAVGDEIVLAHGTGSVSFSMHDDKPFTVSGILALTGTPVDRTVHVSLQGIEAIHIGWQGGVRVPGRSSMKDVDYQELEPESITAFMLGLNSKMATFGVQRQINNYRAEPLLAILPGVALSELWQIIGNIEAVMRIISLLVLLSALFGMCAMLLASMRERSRELAVMRAVGASPWFILALIQMEALLMTVSGMLIAVVCLYGAVLLGGSYLTEQYGFMMQGNILNSKILGILGMILMASLLISLIPALRAYWTSQQRMN